MPNWDYLCCCGRVSYCNSWRIRANRSPQPYYDLQTRIRILQAGPGQAIDGETSTPDGIVACVMQLSLFCQQPFLDNVGGFRVAGRSMEPFRNRSKAQAVTTAVPKATKAKPGHTEGNVKLLPRPSKAGELRFDSDFKCQARTPSQQGWLFRISARTSCYLAYPRINRRSTARRSTFTSPDAILPSFRKDSRASMSC